MKAPPCQFNEIVGKIKVLSMEVRTSLSMEELAERLNEFFGKGASRTGTERGLSRPYELRRRRGPCDGRLLRRGGKNPPEDRDERMGRAGEEVYRRSALTLRDQAAVYSTKGRRRPDPTFYSITLYPATPGPCLMPARPQPGAPAPFRPGAPVRISRRRPGK